MLVEFSVSNFRSISKKITFSAVASSGAVKSSRLTVDTGNSLAPSLLTSAVTFGPNASGKSSFIRSVKFFKNLVKHSAQDRTHGDKINYSRNKLAKGFVKKPSEFEIIFIHKNELFQYGLKINNDKILEEWLFARHSKHLSRTRNVFYRKFVSKKEGYFWDVNDSQLPGEKETWKKATRDNALFLSTAVQLNSKYLQKPFEWICDYLEIIGANERVAHNFTAKLLFEKEDKGQILDLMEALDLHITGFRVESHKMKLPQSAKDMFSEKLLEKFSREAKDQRDYRVFMEHKNQSGEVIELSLNEESDGTQVLFGLAGAIFDVLENGYTLFIDELSNSLHPLALKGLVSIFHNEKLNKRGAQLFFTSHETSIISKNFMHKDQIWFIDRLDGVSTQLRPMSDYSVREISAFQRSYLGGKYGALPNIRELDNVGS